VHEDDPWRGVLTALAIQRRPRPLAPDGTADDEQPIVRIGVATGSVVVTRRVEDRGVEYSTVGDTMRTADRLQQLAEPGTILISDTTRHAIDGCVDVERTAFEVESTATFRVIGPAPARLVRPPRLLRPLAPFVGRVHELGLLANLAARARGGR